jgi:hypothetical protein
MEEIRSDYERAHAEAAQAKEAWYGRAKNAPNPESLYAAWIDAEDRADAAFAAWLEAIRAVASPVGEA